MKSRYFFEDEKKVDARSCYTLFEKVSGGVNSVRTPKMEGNVSNAPRWHPEFYFAE